MKHKSPKINCCLFTLIIIVTTTPEMVIYFHVHSPTRRGHIDFGRNLVGIDMAHSCLYDIF